MISFEHTDLLGCALKALSQCEEHGTMSGHVPAALIASWFFCNEHEVSDVAKRGVQGLLQRLIDGEHVFSGIKFNQLDIAGNGEAATDAIVQIIKETMYPLKASGHNIIFTALALRAISRYSVTEDIITGISKYLKLFHNSGPGWAHVPGQKELVDPRSFLPDSNFSLAPYENIGDMIHAVCVHVVPDHFNRIGVGGSVHLIDHAVAIYDLQEMGYNDLVELGLRAHHEHLSLWMSLPIFSSEDKPAPKPSAVLPLEDAYWQQEIQGGGGGLEHRLKILYGAYRFDELIESQKDRKIFQQTMRYLF